MMFDSGEWLCVDGIEALCTIGVSERERQNKQRLVINLALNVDFSVVGVSDNIHDTVDSRLVSRLVVSEVEQSSFRLVETLASHLGRTVLAQFPGI